jgi:hypothetical protein
MAKSFMMAVIRIARTQYTTLEAGRILSWEQLWDLMLENFLGNYDDPVTFGHLFVNAKCQASGLRERTITDAAQEGLLRGSLRYRLSQRPPQTTSELMRKMEEYACAEDDKLWEKQRKQAEENGIVRTTHSSSPKIRGGGGSTVAWRSATAELQRLPRLCDGVLHSFPYRPPGDRWSLVAPPPRWKP